MDERSDVELLRDYAGAGQEAAFQELVARYTDLVYSAALRQVDSPDVAGDIAQSVFTDLARKAGPLAEKSPANGSLAGWLHRGTRYLALNHHRDTRRRLRNERQAMEQLLINSESAPDWEHIRPCSTRRWTASITKTAKPCCSATSSARIIWPSGWRWASATMPRKSA